MDYTATLLYQRLISDSRQQHSYFTCNPALMEAARAKAQDMGQRDYFAHCDPDGVCSNALAETWGCNLPEFYTPNGNNIESLAAGSPDIDTIFEALAGSQLHATHLFGWHEFFRTQHDIGIGVAEVVGSKYRWYYVVMIAECVTWKSLE